MVRSIGGPCDHAVFGDAFALEKCRRREGVGVRKHESGAKNAHCRKGVGRSASGPATNAAIGQPCGVDNARAAWHHRWPLRQDASG
jgi:hypothetical protein